MDVVRGDEAESGSRARECPAGTARRLPLKVSAGCRAAIASVSRAKLQRLAASTRAMSLHPRRDAEAAELDRDHGLHPLQDRRVGRAQRAEAEHEVHLVGVGQAAARCAPGMSSWPSTQARRFRFRGRPP